MGTGWTRENQRHGLAMLKFGRSPAATVYDSIGPDFFLALDEGWLNLGLWEGDGSDPNEAPVAVRRLVAHLAADLPAGGDVLDVGNGLGAQDPLIAEVASPRSLTALNVTLSQLLAGREQLAAAGAAAVNGDACGMPFADARFDGVISVEAAFHFRSRRAFFAEAFRVLRPGGVLTMSDVPTLRSPRAPREAVAALSQLRLWGLTRRAVASPERIVALAAGAGFVDVRSLLLGDRVIGPALRFVRERLGRVSGVPRTYALAARIMASQAELLWERGILDYLVLRARRPDGP
jgi:cyclopropane fatty-acyl-phospholipid synthase-like methyltransferase